MKTSHSPASHVGLSANAHHSSYTSHGNKGGSAERTGGVPFLDDLGRYIDDLREEQQAAIIELKELAEIRIRNAHMNGRKETIDQVRSLLNGGVQITPDVLDVLGQGVQW